MDDQETLDRAGRFSLGTVVIILYILFVSSVFSGFATYIYRSEWNASLAADTLGPQDLDNLIFAIKREDTLRKELVKVEAQINDDFQGTGTAETAADGSPYLPPPTITELVTEKNRLEKEIEDLPFEASDRSNGRARLESLSTNFFIVKDTFRRLVTFPTIFLTLLVTIAAGGLGTVVAFSRRYYEGSEEISMARLFVNVGEGIAAAMAIFLFSGAGMLALTNGAGTATAVELSPYTVAFVAFLSGFMAEDAFASIQDAGKRIFGRKDKDKAKEDGEPEAEGAQGQDSVPVFVPSTTTEPDTETAPTNGQAN